MDASELLSFISALARQTKIMVSTAGTDMTLQMGTDVLELDYSESISWEADNLTLHLQDREGKYAKMLTFNEGQDLNVKVLPLSWDYPGQALSIDCGTNEIDEVEINGPPDTFVVKACSIPSSSGIKFTRKTRGFEKTTLQALASQIAKDNNLTLDWQAGTQDQPIGRIDQVDETDLQLLSRLFKRFGYGIKVQDKKLVCFDEQQWEKAAPVGTITKGQFGLLRWKFSSKSQDVVRQVITSYQATMTGQAVQGSSTDPNETSGAVDRQIEYMNFRDPDEGHIIEPLDDGAQLGPSAFGVLPAVYFSDMQGNPTDNPPIELGESGLQNDSVTPQDNDAQGVQDATALAQKRHRWKNRHKHQSDMDFVGTVRYLAGQVWAMAGFGKFVDDGPWIAERIAHRVGSGGFVTSVKFRKCITMF